MGKGVSDVSRPIRASVPILLFRAVRKVARDEGVTLSAWVRDAVLQRLAHEVLPALRIRAESEPMARKLRTITLIGGIRKGITSTSAAGRLANQHRRIAYALYCRNCNRSGARRRPYPQWTPEAKPILRAP